MNQNHEDAQTQELKLLVLMPVYNDWESASLLIQNLDQALHLPGVEFSVLLVNDGSTAAIPADSFRRNYVAIRSIRTLHLRRNLGHQRAIALGLLHISSAYAPDAILVMDADGEDTPEGCVALVRAYRSLPGHKKAIFAQRSRRTESLVFRLGYLAFKALHRILTGHAVRVGNFSILPATYLDTLVIMSEIWSHYAAALFHSKLEMTMIPIPRGHRILGKSKMNLPSLVVHGLGAISVYSDILGVRALIGIATFLGLVSLAILAVIYVRYCTDLAVPGWATYAVASLLIILLQALSIAISFTFSTLATRIHLNIVPLRDCTIFIRGEERIFENG